MRHFQVALNRSGEISARADGGGHLQQAVHISGGEARGPEVEKLLTQRCDIEIDVYAHLKLIPLYKKDCELDAWNWGYITVYNLLKNL